jgi:hypothetical protein
MKLRCLLRGHTWGRPRVRGEARSIRVRIAETRSRSAVCRQVRQVEGACSPRSLGLGRNHPRASYSPRRRGAKPRHARTGTTRFQSRARRCSMVCSAEESVREAHVPTGVRIYCTAGEAVASTAMDVVIGTARTRPIPLARVRTTSSAMVSLTSASISPRW